MEIAQEKILNLLMQEEQGEEKSKNDNWCIFDVPTKKETQRINKIIDANVDNYERMIDVSAIRHAKKEHPKLTDKDFCLIPLIVKFPDVITKGKKPYTIVYEKTIGKQYFYVEYVRTGRKRLAMKTFYYRNKKAAIK
ncbi:MAG: hypothetical protein MJ198_05180 [Bacteroidales bacterium]|nr:hypothetical protein [Bacteroidales bacterium]